MRKGASCATDGYRLFGHMTVLTVFLRNLAVILVVGGVGYGLLRLPFNPLLIGVSYASLLAVLMTWSEISHGTAARRRSSAPRTTASKPGKKRPGPEKGAKEPGSRQKPPRP